MAGGIFISYRRSDSAAFAGRIADFFAYHHGDVRVFFDVVAIEPGEDFTAAIRNRLAASQVVLAIIGENWLDARGSDGARRLDTPSDFVRLELAMALEMGKRVIPVLIDNAQMPAAQALPADLQALAVCNGEFMRGAAFQRDAQHLAGFVTQFMQASSEPALVPAPAPQRDVRSQVKSALVSAFEDLRSAPPLSYLIATNPADEFVQFAKMPDADGEVFLDLPSAALTPDQVAAARRLLEEDHRAEQVPLGAGEFTFNLDLPLDPAFLSHITLDVFEHIYGALPDAPLHIEIGQ